MARGITRPVSPPSNNTVDMYLAGLALTEYLMAVAWPGAQQAVLHLLRQDYGTQERRDWWETIIYPVGIPAEVL